MKTRGRLFEKINKTDKLLVRLQIEDTFLTAEIEEKHTNHINIRKKQIIWPGLPLNSLNSHLWEQKAPCSAVFTNEMYLTFVEGIMSILYNLP